MPHRSQASGARASRTLGSAAAWPQLGRRWGRKKHRQTPGPFRPIGNLGACSRPQSRSQKPWGWRACTGNELAHGSHPQSQWGGRSAVGAPGHSRLLYLVAPHSDLCCSPRTTATLSLLINSSVPLPFISLSPEERDFWPPAWPPNLQPWRAAVPSGREDRKYLC